MTGLDEKRDLILEVALEITDFELTTLTSYEADVKQSASAVANRMQANTWWSDFPANRDQFLKTIEEGKELSQIEADILALVDEQFGTSPVILAGNSIYNDRKFIARYLPKLNLKLHY